MPKISVVMPAHNTEPYIRQSVASVLRQTFSDIELIVVDDGSTDNTLHCLETIHDSRLHIIHHEKSQGICASRNDGVHASSGDWVAVLDSDDIAHPNRLSRQLRVGEADKNVAMVTTWTNVMNREGKTYHHANWSFSPEGYFYNLHFRNCITHSSVLIRRKAFDVIHGYTQEIADDYNLYVKAMYHGKIVVVPSYLTNWRKSEQGISTRREADFANAALQISANFFDAYLDQKCDRSTIDVIQRLQYQSLPETVSIEALMNTLVLISKKICEHAPPFYNKSKLQRYANIDLYKTLQLIKHYTHSGVPQVQASVPTKIFAYTQLFLRNSFFASKLQGIPKTHF